MKASVKKINYTPRKLRLVVALVTGMNVDYAMQYLLNVNKKGAPIVLKALKSAVSNANIDPKNLMIDKIYVNESSFKLKRILYAARGRGKIRIKRYSDLHIELKTNNG